MGENPAPGPNNPQDPHGGHPPYGQPQYGQAPAGQPPYGQPQYGQAPAGQPPYGQPQYGQAPAGPPPYGQPQYGQAPAGQPQYGQPPHGQPYPPLPYSAVKTESTNTLAIVSLVSAFFVNIVGIVTGHIALGQIKRTGEQGRGLAIAGVIIGYVSLAAMILAGFLVAGTLSAAINRDAGSSAGSGKPVQSQNVGEFGDTTVGAGGVALPAKVLPGDVDFSSLSNDPTKLEEIGIAASASGEPVQVVVYVDFLCPHCAAFEAEQGPSLQGLRDQGKISLEYRPVGFLDRNSLGTNYSTRSAEAAACVANGSPDSYQDFFDGLFHNQPTMNKSTPNNRELSELAVGVGAGDIESCLENQEFRPVVSNATNIAIQYGVAGTPTVYVDGQQWEDGSFPGFLQKVLDAKK